MTIEDFRVRAAELFIERKYACSEAVLTVANEYLGEPLPRDLIKISTGFRGGMGCGDVCGAISGAVMALGLASDRDTLGGPSPALTEEVKTLLMRFAEREGTLLCGELIAAFPDKEDPLRRKRCTKLLLEIIDDLYPALAMRRESLSC